MQKKKSNLCIVTVHKGNLNNLKATIKSIDAQNIKPSVHIIVAKNICNYQIYFFKKKNRLFFLNKDNSIYDAMNFGKAVSKNLPLLFLNSGDFFLNKTTLFNINKFFLLTKLNYILIFGTQLKYDNILFKININFFKKKKYILHF